MVWTAGFETANGSGNIVYAQHLNHLIMAMRGNYVLDPTAGGLVVTPNASSNLKDASQVDIDIADGVCFNNSTRRNLTSIASINLYTEQNALTSGQSRFVFIYVNSSGTVAKLAGTAATTGNQLPPDVPENSVILAMVTLTYDATAAPPVETADIEDWRIEAPQGLVSNGQLHSESTTGTAPLVVASTTKVANLNADKLDDQEGSYYLNTSTTFGGDVSGTYNAIAVADNSHNHNSGFSSANINNATTTANTLTNISAGTVRYLQSNGSWSSSQANSFSNVLFSPPTDQTSIEYALLRRSKLKIEVPDFNFYVDHNIQGTQEQVSIDFEMKWYYKIGSGSWVEVGSFSPPAFSIDRTAITPLLINWSNDSVTIDGSSITGDVIVSIKFERISTESSLDVYANSTVWFDDPNSSATVDISRRYEWSLVI